MKYVFLGIAIVAEVVATSCLKQSNGFTRLGPSAITLVGYAIAFYFLSQTLKELPTGLVYAMWSGIGIVLVAAVGWLFQGQKLDAPALGGIALILIGVIVMNVFSKSVPH